MSFLVWLWFSLCTTFSPTLSLYEMDNLLFRLSQSETMPTAGRQQLKEQLIETVSQLCRNVLQFESELTVEGLIGITLDHREIFLVNINKTLTTPFVHISGSVDSNYPVVSNPEVIGDVSTPLKQKKCDKWPKDGVHTTTAQICPPSLPVAEQKSGSSESHPCLPIVESGSSLEADVGLRSSETLTVKEDIAENTEIVRSDSELRYTVKLESIGSIVHNSNVAIDNVQPQSVELRLLADAAGGDDGDDDDDVDDSKELSKTFEQQCVGDISNHSSMDDGSQLIISSVFSVKEEPVSDGETLQPPSLQCGLTSNSELPGQSGVCQTPEPVTLADRSSPLQVTSDLFVWCCNSYPRHRLTSREGIVSLSIRHAVCVSNALVSIAKVMCCIQCCLVVSM